MRHAITCPWGCQVVRSISTFNFVNDPVRGDQAQALLHGRWKFAELKQLEACAGDRPILELCRQLRRSERAVRCQLSRRHLSAKVRDGWGMEQLRTDLHLTTRDVLHHLLQGSLRIQSARVRLLDCSSRSAMPDRCKVLLGTRSIPIAEVSRALGWTRRRILACAGCRLSRLRVSNASVKRLVASAAFADARARLDPALLRWLYGNAAVQRSR